MSLPEVRLAADKLQPQRPLHSPAAILMINSHVAHAKDNENLVENFRWEVGDEKHAWTRRVHLQKAGESFSVKIGRCEESSKLRRFMAGR